MPWTKGAAREHAAVVDGAGGVPPLLREGVNCWRVARAERAAVLVDGEEYYDAFAAAAARARRSILILAWDFNSRTRLRCGDTHAEREPAILGDFLNLLAQRHRTLEVRILIWDYPMIYGTDREFPSVYGLGWKSHERITVRYDNTHPVTGSHHQKVVVIDDAVAFCGGLDLTSRRWDTPDHCPNDERRCYDHVGYPPFHDVMMMVDGEAARLLGDLARARWLRATNQRLSPVRQAADVWPPHVPAAMRGVDVGISRTDPGNGTHDAVREVETLYLDMIAAARHSIYLENQYFTSHGIGEALAARLADPKGPEIVVVLRLLSHGWLEEFTMHNLRKALLARLRAADAFGRLHVYYPDIDGLADATCIDVHSKVLVVDDEWLRVGSANVSNRSMGFDTECDLTVEAGGRAAVREAIAHVRHRLLGEHLGVAPERVEQAIGERGSIHGAIEALASPRRTLKRLGDEPEASSAIIALAALADPEQPVRMDELVPQFAPRAKPGRPGIFWLRIAGVAVLVSALAALWRLTPLGQWIDTERVTSWAREFGDTPWTPVAVVVAYLPASVIMFPRHLITLFAVIAFGPWLGFTYAMLGMLLSALLTYGAGMRLDRRSVRRLSGPTLERTIRALRRRGLLAVTALRLVPMGPFAVQNVVAGAMRINLFDFMAGTALGVLPGTAVATIFGDQLAALLRDPADVNVWLAGGMVVALVAATLCVRRWLLAVDARASDRHALAR
jgi:phosphatidylserine/phosphatidylglycerophosphate/cardiolipin synthase-like enzyme/uncharacterized membrane protein YdjX (TVP38/TMEM64 family)